MKKYILFAVVWAFACVNAYAQEEQPVEKIVFQSAYGGSSKYKQITAVYNDSAHSLTIKGKGRGKETLDAYFDAYKKGMTAGMLKANEWAQAEVSRKKGRGRQEVEGYLVRWFVPDSGNFSYTITLVEPE